MRRFPAALCILLAASLPLSSAGKSVYGPEVPGDSAFIRIVNASRAAGRIEPEIGATAWEPVSHGEATVYRPVTPDIYFFSAGGQEAEIIPGPGKYYTIAVLPKGIVVLEDPAHTDPARAQVFLYNFSTLPQVELATADGKTRVIPPVAPGSSGLVVVNAVAAKLAVRSGGSVVKALGDLGLGRGSSFSVFVLGEPGSAGVFTLKAAVKVE